MPHIDYYFTPLSPYTYLAGTRLEQIANNHGATITYKPVDTMALFARTGGTPLADRHDNRKALRLQELRRQSKKAGLPITIQPAHFPTNPAPAAYAIIAAQSEGGGDLGGFVHGLCRACWAEEKDIAQDDVIRDCLKAAGFDPAIAEKGLWAGAEAYERNLEDAIAAGAFGAPFYITDQDERFWGQDRLDDLDQHLAGKL